VKQARLKASNNSGVAIFLVHTEQFKLVNVCNVC